MSLTTNYLNHSSWDCKYHIVFMPKYRKKQLFVFLRKELKDVFHRLSHQKGCTIIEGFLMPDHVHMLISIPPKEAVSTIVGFLKGKSSIWIAQNINQKKRNFAGHKFWERGYFVSTVGVETEIVKKYIQNQEKEDKRLDSLFDR